MRRLGITAKIWLSIGVFVFGASVALGVGQVQGLVSERRLAATNDAIFPASQRAQEADAAFQRMAKAYQDAVLLEDTSALDTADKEAVAIAETLEAASKLDGLGGARAIGAGMGFAVVAGEVRSLAQRSAQAARDTSSLIQESIDRASHGQKRVAQVSSAIESITTSAYQVKSLVNQVSLASSQQAQGIDQVTLAITQMERVTQSTASTAEESAAASQQLSAQAATTLTIVGRLAALAQGDTSAAPESHATMPRFANRSHRSRLDAGQEPGPVVSMSHPTPGQVRTAKPSAEDIIPLQNTGTFGKF